LAAQYAQLARSSAKQLNTGSQNYLAALRNAGTGAAAAGRQQLGMGQNMYQNQINTKYSDLTNQLAMQRLQAQQEAAARTAQARADAAEYGEIPKTVPPTETTEDDDGSAAAAAAVAEAERKKREREAAIIALNAARRNQF
jgi:DNA-binding protein H-NS